MDNLPLIRLILFGITCLVAGILYLAKPIWIVRILFIIPFMSKGLSWDNDPKPGKLQEAMTLLENDPESYEDQYSAQITIIRLTGAVALLIFMTSLCMLSQFSYSFTQLMLFRIVFFVVGIISLAKPVVIARMLYIPEALWKKLFGSDSLSDLTQEKMFLLENDPEMYMNRYLGQTSFIKLSGVAALLCFVVLLCMKPIP